MTKAPIDDLPPDQPASLTSKTWTMRDGRSIAVDNMAIGHVWNAVAMLRRKAHRQMLKRAKSLESQALDLFAYAHDAPDGASLAAEEGACELLDEAATLRCPDNVDSILLNAVPPYRAMLKRLQGDEVP